MAMDLLLYRSRRDAWRYGARILAGNLMEFGAGEHIDAENNPESNCCALMSARNRLRDGLGKPLLLAFHEQISGHDVPRLSVKAGLLWRSGAASRSKGNGVTLSIDDDITFLTTDFPQP
jgi:hypothetical protein